MGNTRVTVEVQGRRLALTNLDKVLYPTVGMVKAEVIDYYRRIAPVMIPHLRGRPATFVRFPDGVGGASFVEKNAAGHRPDWVRTVRLSAPGSTKNRASIDYVVVDDLPTLVWVANLAALELHVPQWQVDPRAEVHDPDLVVFDLDPGPPATVVECSRVAELLRIELERDGLQAWPKTSGRKGMQLYVPVRPTPAERTRGYAKRLAQRLESTHPTLVVSRMTRALRPGKVLIDWSQNNVTKTTVAPYSLRAEDEPTVSTPLTWEEVGACRVAGDLRYTPPQVLDRVRVMGDLLESMLTPDRPGLPAGGGLT